MKPIITVRIALALALALAASCNETAQLPDDPMESETSASLPGRKLVEPLPSPEDIAKDIVLDSATPSQVAFFPPDQQRGTLGSIRVVPTFTATIYPPLNATRMKIVAQLESDAWVLHDKYKTDGVLVSVRAVEEGLDLSTKEMVIDPADPKISQGSSVELLFDIPKKASRLDISVDQRAGGALDNTTLILAYE